MIVSILLFLLLDLCHEYKC